MKTKSHLSQRPWARMGLLLPILFAGCIGGSGGGGSFQGAGVLRGFVTEFEAAGQVFQGGVEGVTVSVQGTDLEATTADDGFFIISGVPPQETTLTFTFIDTSATLNVTVPENTEVDLKQVRIRGGEAKADNIEVIQLPPPVQAQQGPGSDDDDSSGSSDDSGSSANSGSGSSHSGSGSSNSGDDDDGGSDDTSGPGGGDDNGSDDDDNSGSGSGSSGSGSGDDDEEDEPPDDFEVEGLIQSINGASVTVNGLTFIVNGSTEIRDEEGDPIPLSALQPGQDVEVKGDIVSGNAIATRVKRRD